MLKITQAPTTPVQIKQKFTILGTASPSDASRNLLLIIDDQFKVTGPLVDMDGSWRVEFLFQQAGDRHLTIALDDRDSVSLVVRVVAPAGGVTPIPPKTPAPAPTPTPAPTPAPARTRVSFTNVPTLIRADSAFTVGGAATGYQDGDLLVIRVDRTIELGKPKVRDGKWQAALLFRQSGRRLLEIVGAAQDQAQVVLEVLPALPVSNLQILSRRVWRSQPTPSELPNLQPQRITIHHTFVSPTLPTNASQDAESQRMQNIWRSHVQGNGWSDIGYHYIIMPSGRIYEARAEQKRGAHDVVNDGLGIAFDGVYNAATIAPAQFQSAVALCTRLFQRYNWGDPTVPVPTPTANFGTRNLPLICSHRDRVATECPGSEGGRTVRVDDIRREVKSHLT